MNGTTFATGKVGQAFSFGAAKGYIVVPDSDALQSSTVSIEGWFMVTNVPTDESILVSKYFNSAGWTLRISSAFKPSFRVYADKQVPASVDSMAPVDINTWVHLAGTYDGTMARLYANGVEVGIASPVTNYVSPKIPLAIGTANWIDEGYTLGFADEIAVYNRALSANEVRSIYDAGTAGKCSTPVITAQPRNQAVSPGTSATFSVTAMGELPLSYQWLFNSTNILARQTNDTLTLSNVSLDVAGRYSVEITNRFGSVISSSAFLTIEIAGIDDDGDGLDSLDESRFGTDPRKPDTDDDGFSDYEELFVYGTSPRIADSDGDGIPDGWEIANRLDPRVSDAGGDFDFDGLNNVQEYNLWKENKTQRPDRAYSVEGLSDYDVSTGSQDNRFVYDKNDRLIGAEYSQGIAIAYTYDGNDNLIRQTVMSRTNEAGGLPALWTFLNGLTNGTPTDGPFGDVDGDGWSNWQEWKVGTSPSLASSSPSRQGEIGLNLAKLTLPFTPSNFVVGVGQLDGVGAEEMVIGGDGNPDGNTNFLLVLTQGLNSWSTQRVDVGSFGITSLAVGQLSNRPTAAIYVGLRGMTNGSGRVMEFTSTGGNWQSNIVFLSTNESAFVLGARGQDLLVSLAMTNAPEGSLSAISFSNEWNLLLLDTKSAHRGFATMIRSDSGKKITARVLDEGGIQVLTNAESIIVIPEPSAIKPTHFTGNPLVSGLLRGTNASSVFYTVIDDLNSNGVYDFPDDFVIAEYLLTATNSSLLTQFRRAVVSPAIAPSYGLASVNFLNSSNEVFFTAEPEGQLFAWTATNATSPLQRQLFSSQHSDKAWHSLTAVKTLDPGQALAGLRVDPSAPTTCDVILWPPQSRLPQFAALPQTAPAAAILPAKNTLSSFANITIRLWDAEGNAAIPYLQYQFSGSANWLNAKLEQNPSHALSTTPSGMNHALVWNAVADLGPGVTTNVILRARASDMTLVGDWSVGTSFRVETTTNPDSDSDGMLDEWEIRYFGNTAASSVDDPDGDGLNNLAEFRVGTDPRSSASNLSLRVHLEGGQLHLGWTVQPLVPIYLERRFSLIADGTWAPVLTILPVNPAQNAVLPADDEEAYFRLRVDK